MERSHRPRESLNAPMVCGGSRLYGICLRVRGTSRKNFWASCIRAAFIVVVLYVLILAQRHARRLRRSVRLVALSTATGSPGNGKHCGRPARGSCTANRPPKQLLADPNMRDQGDTNVEEHEHPCVILPLRLHPDIRAIPVLGRGTDRPIQVEFKSGSRPCELAQVPQCKLQILGSQYRPFLCRH